MLGKLLGKAVGTVLAAPAIVVKETEEAIDQAGKTIDKAYARLEDDKTTAKR